MKDIIEGISEDGFILGILKNIEDNMPKSYRARITNLKIIQTYLLGRTSKSGSTSSYQQCNLLGVNPDAYTFYSHKQ